MKVGIIGNYGNENNGDEAILKGIIQQLTDGMHVNRKDIIVFSNNPDMTMEKHGVESVPFFYKKKGLSIFLTIVKSYRTMKKIDLLIIGGGGLLMDLYRKGLLLYTTLAQLGKRAGCKVIIYGVGAGPIDTKVGAFFIRSLLKSAKAVSVRDPKSQKLLQQLHSGKEIHITADPALALKPSMDKVSNSKIKKVGVTAVPYFDNDYWPSENKKLNRRYIKGMAFNLDRIVQDRHVELTLYSTKYPQDISAAKDILSFMKCKSSVKLIEDSLSPDDLINISLEQDLVIGTRLHSLILSIVAETPIIGVAYHEKVRDFMEANQLGKYVIPIEHLHESDQWMLNLYDQMALDREKGPNEIQALSGRLRTEASLGIKSLLEEV